MKELEGLKYDGWAPHPHTHTHTHKGRGNLRKHYTNFRKCDVIYCKETEKNEDVVDKHMEKSCKFSKKFLENIFRLSYGWALVLYEIKFYTYKN